MIVVATAIAVLMSLRHGDMAYIAVIVWAFVGIAVKHGGNALVAGTAWAMAAVAALSLVVGGFLIYNTFAMTVAERTRELGLLRALGGGRGQIAGLVLAEAALLGLAGAALGLDIVGRVPLRSEVSRWAACSLATSARNCLRRSFESNFKYSSQVAGRATRQQPSPTRR